MRYQIPPTLYTASKVHRVLMWHTLRKSYGRSITFTSRWLDSATLDDNNHAECREGWIKNIQDVGRADYLVCYGEHGDTLSGTIVEIGAMLAKGGKVYLIGDYGWKTWQHHPLCVVANPPYDEPENKVAAVLDYIVKENSL